MQNKITKSPFKRGKPCYDIQNKANEPTEIYIYDEIGFFGVEAETFVIDLKSITGDVLIRINSPGGDFFDGVTIFNAIRERKAKTDVVIDGLAASAASYIAMAGDTVTMNQGGMLMIHEAMSIAIGNAKDMEKASELLDKIDGQIANFYAKRAGKPLAEIRDLMAAETWFDGNEAQEIGFVDEVADEQPAENMFDLSVLNNVPNSLQQEPEGGTPTIRHLEAALRDAGLTRQEAKAVLSEGKNALEETNSEEAWAMIKQLEMTLRG